MDKKEIVNTLKNLIAHIEKEEVSIISYKNNIDTEPSNSSIPVGFTRKISCEPCDESILIEVKTRT